MICIQIQWWLWNQLFQYAFGQVIAKHYNTKVIYDIGTYDPLSVFSIMSKLGFFTTRKFELSRLVNDLQVASVVDKFRLRSTIFHKIYVKLLDIKQNNHKSENIWYIYDQSWLELNDTDKINYFFSGTWNVAKYYESAKSEIVRKISLKSRSYKLVELSDLLAQQKNDWIETIAIHVRRWDYVKLWMVICDANYYENGIKQIIKNSWNAGLHIYIFSDDHDQTLCDLPFLADYDKTFVNFDDYEKANNCQIKWWDDIEKFDLMSQCKNHIIANSTYSRRWAYIWWDNGTVIAPINWIKWVANNEITPKERIKL